MGNNEDTDNFCGYFSDDNKCNKLLLGATAGPLAGVSPLGAPEAPRLSAVFFFSRASRFMEKLWAPW